MAGPTRSVSRPGHVIASRGCQFVRVVPTNFGAGRPAASPRPARSSRAEVASSCGSCPPTSARADRRHRRDQRGHRDRLPSSANRRLLATDNLHDQRSSRHHRPDPIGYQAAQTGGYSPPTICMINGQAVTIDQTPSATTDGTRADSGGFRPRWPGRFPGAINDLQLSPLTGPARIPVDSDRGGQAASRGRSTIFNCPR